MVTGTATPKPKRRKRVKRAVYAAALGLVLGFSCPYWPESWQPACELAAKLLGLFFGV